jgi:hypothetical protein
MRSWLSTAAKYAGQASTEPRTGEGISLSRTASGVTMRAERVSAPPWARGRPCQRGQRSQCGLIGAVRDPARRRTPLLLGAQLDVTAQTASPGLNRSRSQSWWATSARASPAPCGDLACGRTGWSRTKAGAGASTPRCRVSVGSSRPPSVGSAPSTRPSSAPESLPYALALRASW